MGFLQDVWNRMSEFQNSFEVLSQQVLTASNTLNQYCLSKKFERENLIKDLEEKKKAAEELLKIQKALDEAKRKELEDHNNAKMAMLGGFFNRNTNVNANMTSNESAPQFFQHQQQFNDTMMHSEVPQLGNMGYAPMQNNYAPMQNSYAQMQNSYFMPNNSSYFMPGNYQGPPRPYYKSGVQQPPQQENQSFGPSWGNFLGSFEPSWTKK